MTGMYRVSVTPEFLRKVLKHYTRKLEDAEMSKNGKRKQIVTKAYVCRVIVEDMERKGLI